MRKELLAVTISIALLSGCGGGGGTSGETTNTDTTAVIDDSGKTDGSYNLWAYMTPSSSKTNTYIETTSDGTETYSTTFTTTDNSVIEVSDYAPNERTIYSKKSDRITISFEKDNAPNGSYDLDLTADIGDIVTVAESTCTLTAHFDAKTFNNTTFNDVIEITCAGKPGYYQYGIGEVAQLVDTSTATTDIRIMSR